MGWLEYHRQSEQLASNAEVTAHRGDSARARELYIEAAQAEEKALQEVELAKSRTYGITAVSAVSLYFKATEWKVARNLAHRCLVLQPQIEGEAAFVMAETGSGLMAPPPSGPLQYRFRLGSGLPDQAVQQPAHLGNRQRYQGFIPL